MTGPRKMFTRRRCTHVLSAVLLILGLTSISAATAQSVGLPADHQSHAATAGRTLVWSDEFNTLRVTKPNAAAWQTMTGGGGWGNNELESYTSQSSNAYQRNGSLHIVARKQNYTGTDGIARSYTSARLMGLRPFTYGYLKARIKIPQGAGLWHGSGPSAPTSAPERRGR